MLRIGLVSDTHGLLRPQALQALHGSDHLVHAGDIGHARILEALAAIAPVTAVRGNNDHGPWAEMLPPVETLRLGGVVVHVLHDLAGFDAEAAAAAGVRVVVSGHSHKPRIEERGGMLFVNPGSAGPRRFKLPIAVGELRVDGTNVEARIVELDVQNGRR